MDHNISKFKKNRDDRNNV